MLIVLNNETLTRNIEYDHKKGSNAGDVILNQDANNPKKLEYKLSDFDNIPDRSDLHTHNSLISKKSASKVYKVFVFDKFEVNGDPIDTDNNLIVFIRESGKNPPKLRLICQGMNRTMKEENVDNGKVLDDISRFLNHKAFTVQALEYKEKTDVLNFIIFLYGEKNKSSEIFRDSRRMQRKLRGYNNYELLRWSNMEFVSHFLRLLRRYELDYIIPLLYDEMYCIRNLSMKNAFLNSKSDKETYEEGVFLFGQKVYISNTLTKNSRIKLWDLLLDRVEAISDEIIYENESSLFKGLKVPSAITYKEADNILLLNFENDKTNNRNYLYNQDIFEGNYVLLVNDDASKIEFYNIFEVKSMREEVMMLEKTEMIVNVNEEEEILSIVKDEIKNGY